MHVGTRFGVSDSLQKHATEADRRQLKNQPSKPNNSSRHPNFAIGSMDIDFSATASLLKRIEHRAATAAPYPRNETAHATSDQPHLRAFKHDLQTVAVVSRLYPPVKSLDHPPVKGRPASWKRAWQGLFQAVLSEKDKPFVSSNANAMTAMTRSLGHGHLRPLQPLLAIEFLVAIRRFPRR
jgi:hypothetical protein